MNFNAPLLRPVRILLFPFSLVYGLAVWTRNLLFDKGLIGSSSFNLPLIGIGNLSAGGTGKSPMVEYLLNRFRHRYRMAVLSRGYKRKTRGYALAGEGTTALEIGDEPMQFYLKFPEVGVAVGEERIVAIPQLLHDRPDTEVILLDDAFQHRYVRAGLDILLTDYDNLFTRDWFLPTGDLRDLPSAYRRANLLVVTKCPRELSSGEARKIAGEIHPLSHQHLFFATIRYGAPYHLLTRAPGWIDGETEVLLVSGIANPYPLKTWLADRAGAYFEMLYSDHHIFTIDDWKEMRKRFETMSGGKKIMLTTEKDAVRLMKFRQEIASLPLYVLPMEMEFLWDGGEKFDALVEAFIAGFRQEKRLEYGQEKA